MERKFYIVFSPKYKPNRKRLGFTLADMCNVASNIGDKMIQSREKVFFLMKIMCD